ncbi:hypothetical protein OIDMADRAFT_144082 [Oidiodendron maius Zn]|uniref:C2H2-type domain-containing protein n=1 Tax=Oidiodendron maius (strain Zn) TaxID=913774 RepID=A0A0C3CV87_OIDMZ|nr:hypothetical protein OIDMADRAFT_144082 [Oidiodendron maius Zn]
MIKSPQIPNFPLFLLITLSTLVVPQPQIGGPATAGISQHDVRQLDVADDILDVSLALAAATTIPENVAHLDFRLSSNYLLHDTPLRNPFFDFELGWPGQRITDEAEQFMNPGVVPSLADSSCYLPEFDTRSQDNFFYAPPEDSRGDHLLPQSHEWWMAVVGHEFLQIPGDSAKFTTPSLLASESSLDPDPVELLMNLIASQDIPSVTYNSPSLDGKMQLGKPNRAVDSVEDEREGSATSILANETAVCEWKNCVSKFRSRSELRKHARSHTLCAKFCEWAECKRFAEKRATLNKHLDTHIKPHVCPDHQRYEPSSVGSEDISLNGGIVTTRR